MNLNMHERAQELIALGVDETWLRGHLQECAACRNYAEAVRQTLSSLRSQPSAADFALVQRTQMEVRARSAILRQRQARAWLVCFSCLFVVLSAAVTTPLFWRAFAWLGERGSVSNGVWQTGFAFFVMAPALMVSVLLLAHGTYLTNNEEDQGF